jgi:hypothetical protein
MGRIYVLLLACFFDFGALNAQSTMPPQLYTQSIEQQHFDSLKQQYSKHKILPPGFELQALIALSYYPELTNAHIKFRVKKAKLPYASRPRLGSLLIPFAHKKYQIIISNQSNALRAPTLLKNLEFNAQIGALGHELAHTAHYRQSHKWKILGESIWYLSTHFKERFEKMTDRIAMEHGLCPQIYTWNKAVYPVKLKDGERAKIYYTPEEILDICEGHNRFPHK